MITKGLITTSMLLTLWGCAQTPPIQLVNEGMSTFDGALYSNRGAMPGSGAQTGRRYRLIQRDATGAVSTQMLSASAHARADEYCQHEFMHAATLGETTSVWPRMMSKAAEIELVFECIDSAADISSAAVNVSGSRDQDKYSKIERIKALLDSGALTQAEFDAEKAKILSDHQP